MINKTLLVIVFAMFYSLSYAANPAVFSLSAKRPLAEATQAVSTQLEAAGYAVVDELPISENLKRMAGKWGDDYNRNKLEGITSLVFCSGWYVNQVSNLDPQLLGLCPLHVTLTHKGGVTTALFNRPTALAAGSPAKKVLLEAENEVIAALKSALQGK